MGKITKKDAIRIVVGCAEKYKDNLVDRTLLFILSDKHKNTSSLEVTFNASNFLHLTGLKIYNPAEEDDDKAEVMDSNMLTTKMISPKEFYRRCLKHELSEEDFEFADDGTTEI